MAEPVTTSVLPSLLAFIAVIALIPVALAVLKRAQRIRPNRQGPLNMVAGLPVGPRERIAIVETGGRWLVIGITAQSISLLTTLDQAPAGTGSDAAPNAEQRNLFAQILSNLGNKDASPRS